MKKTEYYNLDVTEGSDIANIPASQSPNITKIDEQMHANATNGFSPATEVLNGMVHNLTRMVPDAPMIRWIATAPYAAGDTFTVDGIAVTARTVSGEGLPSGAYIIGQCVQAFVDGENMTVYVSSGNAQLFNNRPASWYQRSLSEQTWNTYIANVALSVPSTAPYVYYSADLQSIIPTSFIDLPNTSDYGIGMILVEGLHNTTFIDTYGQICIRKGSTNYVLAHWYMDTNNANRSHISLPYYKGDQYFIIINKSKTTQTGAVCQIGYYYQTFA